MKGGTGSLGHPWCIGPGLLTSSTEETCVATESGGKVEPSYSRKRRSFVGAAVPGSRGPVRWCWCSLVLLFG